MVFRLLRTSRIQKGSRYYMGYWILPERQEHVILRAYLNCSDLACIQRVSVRELSVRKNCTYYKCALRSGGIVPIAMVPKLSFSGLHLHIQTASVNKGVVTKCCYVSTQCALFCHHRWRAVGQPFWSALAQHSPSSCKKTTSDNGSPAGRRLSRWLIKVFELWY